MSNLAQDFKAYLKAVFLESSKWILTLFDIVGILLFFQPRILEELLQNEQMARAAGLGLFLLSFLISNFMVFRKQMPKILDEQALLLFPHYTRITTNAIRMRYEGFERADNLIVMQSYKDKTNNYKNN
jgi:hypothetical protein